VPCDPKVALCACDLTGSCSDGKLCVDDLCIHPCDYTYQCGPGKVCANGACVAGCSDQLPCEAGFSCAKGVCWLDPAAPACDGSHPCPSGEICIGGLCTTGCASSAECKPGEACDGESHACIADPSPQPKCDATHPCPSPQVCKADGYCHYPCATTDDCKLIDNRFVSCDTAICKTQAEVAPECTLQTPCAAGQSCISNTCL
jgi:hypothetical protein